MFELFVVIYILLIFLFPVPVFAATLGIGTTALLSRKYYLFKSQPPAGRRILVLNFWTGAANLFMSLLVSGAMAFAVYLIILDNLYLLAFNFLFCLGVSIRWFDFANGIYRKSIMKMLPADSGNTSGNPLFAMCVGLRKGTGWGIGMAPVFIDSGNLLANDSGFSFNGVFFKVRLESADIQKAEKISFEKIKVFTSSETASIKTEALLFALRDEFYPFRSRTVRNKLFGLLTGTTEDDDKAPVTIPPRPVEL